MRDPAVRLDVAAAADEIMQFLTLRKRWLAPTQHDWSDVHERAWLGLRLGRRMRWYIPAKRLLIELHHETELDMPADLRDEICKQLVEAKRLPPGRAAQTGRLAPRNVAIAGALMIALRRGFDLTRYPGQEKHSACSLVCKALKRLGVKLDERQIQRIGKKCALPL